MKKSVEPNIRDLANGWLKSSTFISPIIAADIVVIKEKAGELFEAEAE